MRTLIIADAQDITRLGIKYLAKDVENVTAVHEALDKQSMLTLLSLYPDSLIVLDYVLSEFASINELRILHERYPNADWLLFSEELSDTFLREMHSNSLPFSIVLKSSSLEEIKAAVEVVSQKESFLCKRVESHIKSLTKSYENSSIEHLTNTEKEVLKEIALGKTTKEIAAERNLSFHTVITHRKNIFRKLEVNNVHEATKYAMRAGIVDVSEYYI